MCPRGNADPAGARLGQLGVLGLEAAHVVRRVAGPALAADVLVEAAVAVGDDVQPGHFLLAQVDRQRVHVLLAEPRRDHRVQERRVPRFSVYQLGRGSDPVMVVGSMIPAVALSTVSLQEEIQPWNGTMPDCSRSTQRRRWNCALRKALR